MPKFAQILRNVLQILQVVSVQILLDLNVANLAVVKQILLKYLGKSCRSYSLSCFRFFLFFI